MNKLDFSLGRAFPKLTSGILTRGWGVLSQADFTEDRATQKNASLPDEFVFAVGSSRFRELRMKFKLLFLFTLSGNVPQTRRGEVNI